MIDLDIINLLNHLDRRFTLHLMCTTRTFDVYCSRGWHHSTFLRRVDEASRYRRYGIE